MTHDRPVLGIVLMIGFCLTIPFSDAFAKLAGASLPLAVLILARMLAQGAAMTALARAQGVSLRLTRRAFWLTVIRSVLNLGGLAAIFGAFRVLPLADAIAIAYVMPFILFFLGHYFMGEVVGWRRVVAALFGFVGTVLVIQPSFAAVGLAALLPVVGAVCFAVFILVTRVLAQEANATALQAVSGWVSIAMMVPLMGLGSALAIYDLTFVWPHGAGWAYLAGIGFFGTLAHLLMVQSLAHAPSSTVAPIQYLEIPMAALVSWWIFREFPNGLALLGIGIILCAGLYILWRERAVMLRQARPEADPVHWVAK
ncbi:MAG: DMT family transporter [Pseudomonadota bacterium]